MPEFWDARSALQEARPGVVTRASAPNLGILDAVSRRWFVGIPRPLLYHSKCITTPAGGVVTSDNPSEGPNKDGVIFNSSWSDVLKNAIIVGIEGPFNAIYGLFADNSFKAGLSWTPLSGGTRKLTLTGIQDPVTCSPIQCSETFDVRKIRAVITHGWLSKMIGGVMATKDPNYLNTFENKIDNFARIVRVGDKVTFTGAFLSPRDANLSKISEFKGSFALDAFADADLLGSVAFNSPDIIKNVNSAGRKINIYATNPRNSTFKNILIGSGVTDANGNWSADCVFNTASVKGPDATSGDLKWDQSNPRDPLTFAEGNGFAFVIKAAFEDSNDPLYQTTSDDFFNLVAVLPKVVTVVPDDETSLFVPFTETQGIGQNGQSISLGFTTKQNVTIQGKLAELDAEEILTQQNLPAYKGNDTEIEVYFTPFSALKFLGGASKEQLITTITKDQIVDGRFKVDIPMSEILSKIGVTRSVFNSSYSLGTFRLKPVSTTAGVIGRQRITRPVLIFGSISITGVFDLFNYCVGENITFTGLYKVDGEPVSNVEIYGQVFDLLDNPVPGSPEMKVRTGAGGAFYFVFPAPAPSNRIVGQAFKFRIMDDAHKKGVDYTIGGINEYGDAFGGAFRTNNPRYVLSGLNLYGTSSQNTILKNKFVGDEMTLSGQVLKFCVDREDLLVGVDVKNVTGSSFTLTLNDEVIDLKPFTDSDGKFTYKFTLKQGVNQYCVRFLASTRRE